MQVSCIHVTTVHIESFGTKSLINEVAKAVKASKKLQFSSNVEMLQFLSLQCQA